jgi:hypothetical protein
MKTDMAFISEPKGNNKYELSAVFRTQNSENPFVRVTKAGITAKYEDLRMLGVSDDRLRQAMKKFDRPGNVYGGVTQWMAQHAADIKAPAPMPAFWG